MPELELVQEEILGKIPVKQRCAACIKCLKNDVGIVGVIERNRSNLDFFRKRNTQGIRTINHGLRSLTKPVCYLCTKESMRLNDP